ncbi:MULTISPECIES: RraA family protein [Streptomyces]|uniref:Putative 4-hydroxy-4-methyl-2-oxoglutarate aldolase n=1 Tax=Streptomyces dengpaensis TaxID=2049881 RepID=A0ABN5HVV9_9ACTN|nr:MULTISPECIES: RraA family protein [Streptomyces]AVH54740.1 dimethylmenaquinone methyltransferase [Streptomyces dengpaensis]PIB03849.1 dimethylmenaquinone methyltransferase [Streptomyces sp. HG99]
MADKNDRVRDLASQVRTPDVVDAMGRIHRHRCHINDLVSPTPDRVLLGPAVTISYLPSCEETLPAEQFNFIRLFDDAIGDGAQGRVLVLASNGHTDVSLGGGAKLSLVAVHGLAGILADGRLRDFPQIASYDFAAYCWGETTKWGGDVVTPFEANRPVVVSGVTVHPGDYVFADASGAAVIPAEQVLSVFEEANRVVQDEAAFVERTRHGNPADYRSEQ